MKTVQILKIRSVGTQYADKLSLIISGSTVCHHSQRARGAEGGYDKIAVLIFAASLKRLVENDVCSAISSVSPLVSDMVLIELPLPDESEQDATIKDVAAIAAKIPVFIIMELNSYNKRPV